MREKLFSLLDNYFNRTYIYNLQSDLFFEFNLKGSLTKEDKVVHLEVESYKNNEYILKYKIGKDLCFTWIKWSKNKEGLLNLVYYDENYKEAKRKIQEKLKEREEFL